jgi:hypothetical protein
VDFPEWDVRGVLAKIDTGACVSALHVTDIERLEGDRVAFHVALDRKMSQLSERIVASLRRETKIRSSNGVVQHRYIVCVTMDVGGVRQPIEVSLVCRKSMRCRMLLGREGLSGAFLVDPERDYLLTTRPEKPPRKPRKTSTRRSGAAGGSRREESKKRASGSTRTNTGAGSSRGSSPGGATMDAETGKRSAP